MTRLFSLFMDSMFHIRIYVGVRELMLDRELLETDMVLLFIERFLSVHSPPKYKQRYWGRNYRLQSKSVNSETMKIFRILSLSLASAYEQFDYESELGLARWVIWVVGCEQPIYDFFRGRGQREGEIMAYSFNGEEDADEMMNALYSLAGK